MTKHATLRWMSKVIVVLTIFSSVVLYADGTESINDWNINATDNSLSTFKDIKCTAGAVAFPLGRRKESFCLKRCFRDSNCQKDEKCAKTTAYKSKLCFRNCDVDDDCEYPTKCNTTAKFCFYNSCISDDDCQNSLTCSLPADFNYKLCSRRSCYRGNGMKCDYNQTCDLKAFACQCANGMSGKKCEVAEWCKDKGKFKDCKGANGTCGYIKSEGAINCICDKGKKLHPVENRCRETCAKETDCENGGVCKEIAEFKFCSCKLGIIGDKCETVYDCTPDGKYKNCESSGGKCFYDGAKAICECPGDKKLNDNWFICEDITFIKNRRYNIFVWFLEIFFSFAEW